MTMRFLLIFFCIAHGMDSNGQTKFDVNLSRIFKKSLLDSSINEIIKFARLNDFALITDSTMTPYTSLYLLTENKSHTKAKHLKSESTIIDFSDSVFAGNSYYTQTVIIKNQARYYIEDSKLLEKHYKKMVASFKDMSTRNERFDMFGFGRKIGEGVKFYCTKSSQTPDLIIEYHIDSLSGLVLTSSRLMRNK